MSTNYAEREGEGWDVIAEWDDLAEGRPPWSQAEERCDPAERMHDVTGFAGRVSTRQLFARDRHRCWYCGCDDQPLTVDHVDPRSGGGNDTVANVVTACGDCNVRKAAKTLDPITETLWRAYELDANDARGWGQNAYVDRAR